MSGGERADAEGETPRWLSSGLRALVGELALFLTTAAAITTRPQRFAAAWSQGKQRALNPLGYLGTSVALVGPLQDLLARASGGAHDRPLWVDLLAPVEPYVYYAGIALLSHALLRLVPGPTQPLRTTLGLMLYVGGGPAALAGLLVGLLDLPALKSGLVFMLLFSVALWLAVVFIQALTGAHGRRDTALLAFVIAFIVWSTGFGWAAHQLGEDTAWYAFWQGWFSVATGGPRPV